MTADNKDKALMAANFLVGYCLSVEDVLSFYRQTDGEALRQWGLILLDLTKITAIALEKAWDETTRSEDGEPK